MSIEVVGQDDSVKKKVTCKHCGAILQYTPEDKKYQSLSCMGESAGGYDYITCPKCKKEVKL